MERNLQDRRRSQSLRKSQTKEENHLWYDFFEDLSHPVSQTISNRLLLCGFYCYHANLVVELDGSQHTEPDKIRYDAERTKFLESQGLKVLRFYNTDIWKNFSGVCQIIDREAKYRAGAANLRLPD